MAAEATWRGPQAMGVSPAQLRVCVPGTWGRLAEAFPPRLALLSDHFGAVACISSAKMYLSCALSLEGVAWTVG